MTSIQNKSLNIIVTGGGTGGHLFPGIAVAEGLQERFPECRIMFIGTKRHLDKSTLSRYPFELRSIQCEGLKGKGLRARLSALMQLPIAVFAALTLIRSFQPCLVFGVGGYVTGPVLLAAKLRGIPTCIHEQNSVPGMANTLLARLVNRIFISIPVSNEGKTKFPESKTVLTGNPVRQEILAAAQTNGKSGEPATILILGGSQGAHSINMMMIKTAGIIKNTFDKPFRIIHQTGQRDKAQVKKSYGEMGIDAQVENFFHNMAELYAQADIVVSRAGATTLAELSVMGLPALLIPYPYAADNHQELNARYYENGGGTGMLKEADLTGKILAGKITDLLKNQHKMHSMRDCMSKLGRPDATEKIVNNCMELSNYSTTAANPAIPNPKPETHV